MQYLTETPLYPALFGAFLTICFGVMYAQSKDKRVLPFLFLALLTTIVPLVIDGLVMTDREKLINTISRLASAVSANDVEASADYTHPDFPTIRRRIENEMPTYEFAMCTITGFNKIEIDEADPEKAKVAFVVFVNVSAPKLGHKGVATRGVSLDMQLYNGEWKITNYQHY